VRKNEKKGKTEDRPVTRSIQTYQGERKTTQRKEEIVFVGVGEKGVREKNSRTAGIFLRIDRSSRTKQNISEKP